MNPRPSLWEQLHMLWSGEGLEAMFASFPPNLAALLVQWLPWVFRLAVLFMIFAIVFRAWRALGGGGGSGGRHVRGSRLKTVRFCQGTSKFDTARGLIGN